MRQDPTLCITCSTKHAVAVCNNVVILAGYGRKHLLYFFISEPKPLLASVYTLALLARTVLKNLIVWKKHPLTHCCCFQTTQFCCYPTLPHTKYEFESLNIIIVHLNVKVRDSTRSQLFTNPTSALGLSFSSIAP